MRILYLGNNWLGWQVLKWLKEQGEDIVGLVVHPPGKQRYAGELLAEAGLPAAGIFEATRLNESGVRQAIEQASPEVGVSVLFNYVLQGDFIASFPRGVVNLHPAYLPYNRGQYPNVWSIIEGTPAGVTLHYIDEGIDTGGIIARREVPVEPVDTGESLYRKLEATALELFRETWPLIKAGRAQCLPRDKQAGTYHRTRDIEAIDAIDQERDYKAGDLLNLLRARTFPPYKGAYFTADGKRVYLRLQLEYGQEDER